MKVNVSIAAYNAENNISRLVSSILTQKERGYNLEKVVVYSDASSDKTIANIRKITDRRLKILDAKERKGFAYVFKYLLESNRADLVITLNDDIIINDSLFLSKTAQLFQSTPRLGLVSAHLKPLHPKNFIEKAATSGFNAFNNMAQNYKNGSNIFTCDGKSLSMSKEFIESLVFPPKLEAIGNVDEFVYLSCLENNFLYKFSKYTIVYFKFPSTLSDFIKWQTRNGANIYLLKKRFRKLIDKEYRIPLIFKYYQLVEFMKNPLGSLFIYIVGKYCLMRAKSISDNFTSTWDLVASTKRI